MNTGLLSGAFELGGWPQRVSSGDLRLEVTARAVATEPSWIPWDRVILGCQNQVEALNLSEDLGQLQ